MYCGEGAWTLFECSIQCLDGCWVTQTYMDKVPPSFSERRLTYEIFSNVKAGRCDDCVFQRLCVCVEGWLYTWLKGNIVAVESLLFLRDSFPYTMQPRHKQVLNRQEATKKPTKNAGIQEHIMCGRPPQSQRQTHNNMFSDMEIKQNYWLLKQLLCQAKFHWMIFNLCWLMY